ncbi:hypothetical protein HDU84_005388, partial [Entophlyctis sp. JEL0112]
MPFPKNLETAVAVEAIVRDQGAVPATIALLDGVVKVGLSRGELERLSQAGQSSSQSLPPAVKASRRDLGVVLAKRWIGSTTVAATALIANAVGIRVFVTGGIGGVHRGGESSMDVSADLTELSKSPVAVVCAGVKSILDIGRTLEYLETQGVPVITYQSDSFPAFYTPTTSHKGIARMDSPEECAEFIYAQNSLGLSNGSVIAVPIPEKDVCIDGEALDSAIDAALTEAEASGIKGKDITPFLLSKVKDMTEGKSLDSNIALIKNNAIVGSQIAVCLSRLAKSSASKPVLDTTGNNNAKSVAKLPKILVVGATNLDITGKFHSELSGNAKSAPGTVRFALGGVGRNIFESCFRTKGGNVFFSSTIANDDTGKILLSQMTAKGLPLFGIQILPVSSQFSTSLYSGIFDKDGTTVAGVADMTIHESVGRDIVHTLQNLNPEIIAWDANIHPSVIAQCIEYANKKHAICMNTNISPGLKRVFEPTSVPKAAKIFEVMNLGITLQMLRETVKFITPNDLELSEIYSKALKYGYIDGEVSWKLPADMKVSSEVALAALSLSMIFDTIIVKLGSDGVFAISKCFYSASYYESLKIRGYRVAVWNEKLLIHFPSYKTEGPVVSVTGAGDSMVGVMLTGLSRNLKIEEILEAGLMGAKFSLESDDA